MACVFLIAALVIAIVDWLAVARDWQKVEWVCKPSVMLALLAFLGFSGAFGGRTLWFVGGVIFSLVGDVCLMWPREQFIAGLVAFLVGHLCYLVGFALPAPPLELASLVLAVVIALAAVQIYRRIEGGLRAKGKNKLRIPVLIYSIVISLMLLSALLTLVRQDWSPIAALTASSGALLFFLSDTLLAWNKFVQPLRYRRLPSMICYHVGQILIALGVVLQFFP